MALGLGHPTSRLPLGKLRRNGAVERFNVVIEHSQRGEADGLTALRAAWDAVKASATSSVPYAGRAGFQLARVWAGLASVRVRCSTDRQGKLSRWDRQVRIGPDWPDQEVVVTFVAERQRVVFRDKHG